MHYAELISLVSSVLKVVFLSVYQEWPAGRSMFWVAYLFALNGLPIFIVWIFLRRYINMWAILIVLLFVDLLCFVDIAKLYILDDPVRYSDIYELSNIIGVKNSIINGVPSIAYIQLVDLFIPVLILANFSVKDSVLYGKVYFFNFFSNLMVRCRYSIVVTGLFVLIVVYISVCYLQIPASKPPFRKGFTPWSTEVQKYSQMGAFNYFVTSGIHDFVKFYRRLHGAPSKDEVALSCSVLSQVGNIQNLQVNTIGRGKPNVILVLMESVAKLDFDAPIIISSGVKIAPFLESLRDQLFYSTNIFSPMYGGATSECELTILASLNTRFGSSGYAYSTLMDHEYIALPRLLNKYGYYSAVFHPYKRDFWHRENAYAMLGFDRYDSEEHYKTGLIVGMGLSDDDFLTQTADKLRQLPQPFFSLIITLSGHHPFTLPKELTSGITGGMPMVAPYAKKHLENVNYVDRSLEKFWRNIQELRENSIVVFVGDHNPPLPDGDDWKSLGYKIEHKTDAFFLPSKQVPLIISAPFLSGKVENMKDVMGDQADIAPSLLNLLGIEKPRFFVGHSLFSRTNFAIQFTDDIYYDDKYHFIGSTGECFDNNRTKLVVDECDNIKKMSLSIKNISNDVLWGHRYSYE